MCHPGQQDNFNPPCVADTAMVPTPASTVCGPPSHHSIPLKSTVATGFISDGKSYASMDSARFSQKVVSGKKPPTSKNLAAHLEILPLTPKKLVAKFATKT